MREVSDSLHLRRFCLSAIDVEVPDESTVRKLTRRLGAETVAELSRLVTRGGAAGDALAGARARDRLDGRRGRRALPDRGRAGGRWGAGTRARGAAAGGAGGRDGGAGAG